MTKEKHDAEKIFNEFFIVGLRVDSSPIAESFNFAADIFVKVGSSKWKYPAVHSSEVFIFRLGRLLGFCCL